MKAPLLGIPRRSQPLPPIPLLSVRFEPAINFRDHGYVTVAELAGDELERGAGPRHPDGPVVASVMQPEPFESDGAQPLAMQGTSGACRGFNSIWETTLVTSGFSRGKTLLIRMLPPRLEFPEDLRS